MATPIHTANSQAPIHSMRNSNPAPFSRERAFPPLAGPSATRPGRIAVIGNHLPRHCGIATFTSDLCDAISAEFGSTGLQVVAVNDEGSNYLYPARVRSEIAENELSSYRATASLLNTRNVELVCLQHEFGIFGGKAGSYILELLRGLNMPVVTTLHTVLSEPDSDQRSVMQQIVLRSERLIVMSEYSSSVLQKVFGVSPAKIDLIPHGIPDLPFVEPEVYKYGLGIGSKTVLLTFGLLSKNKGFETVIRALPKILERHSQVIYVIAGATHPHVRAREGDQYRDQLQTLAREYGVERQVVFHNRFLSPLEMASMVGSADIYITPYCYAAQAVSGTLAYAMGAGKAIISTPYWHAAELLNEQRGVLVPFQNPAALAAEAVDLLDNDVERNAMRKRAYVYARQMVWNKVAQAYMRSFSRAYAQDVQVAPLVFPSLAVEPLSARHRSNA